MQNTCEENHFSVIKKEWRKVVVITLIILLLTLGVTLLRPFLYRSTVSIFVVQKSSFSIDAYSASKSEERIANKLAQIIYSSSFLEKILYAGFDIDTAYFPKDESKRRDKWSKTIEASVPSGVSKLEISIYHLEPVQALNISKAIAYTLTEQKKDFIGIEDVELKVLDTPLVSKYPVKPNVILNLILGLGLGFVFGIIFVIATYDPRKYEYLGSHDELQPHLISNNEISENESVEDEFQEINELPEITDLDEVEDLEEAQEDPEKPIEDEEPVEEIKQFTLPDISKQFDNQEKVEQKKQANFKRPTAPQIPKFNKQSQDKPKKDLSKFEDEDRFVGMPEV